MKRFVVSTFLLFLLISPILVSAQATGGLVPCSGPDCLACHVVSLGQNLLTWFITVMVSVIALVFAWGGLKMVMSAGNTEGITQAKGMMTNAIVGLVIMLSAWLIVDTIMKLVITDDATVKKDLGVWNEIECVPPPGRTSAPITTPGTVTSGTGVVGIGQLSHADALARLQGGGVVVTSTTGEGGVRAECPSGSGCTSLHNLREQTVLQALIIKEACPSCAVAIVGATEGGHSAGPLSHSAGYKMDIDDNRGLDSFLESKLSQAGVRAGANGGPRYLDSCGNEYVRESTHWDITVSKGSCRI